MAEPYLVRYGQASFGAKHCGSSQLAIFTAFRIGTIPDGVVLKTHG